MALKENKEFFDKSKILTYGPRGKDLKKKELYLHYCIENYITIFILKDGSGDLDKYTCYLKRDDSSKIDKDFATYKAKGKKGVYEDIVKACINDFKQRSWA